MNVHLRSRSRKGRSEDGLPEACREDAGAVGQSCVNVLHHRLLHSLHVELLTRVQVQPDEPAEPSARRGAV